MKISNKILVNGSYEPEENLNTGFGQHFDGEKFIFFESKEEQEEFINQLNNINN